MLLMPRKSVPKAKQDAFEHICGQRRTVVKQLSDRLPTVQQNNTPGDPHTIHPRMLCSVRTMWIALLHEYMYACACPTSIPSVREQNNACCRWCMRTCQCVWAARWVCTHAFQHVGACILLFCNVQRTLGTDWFW
mmetsp:Transcript_100196/g.161537  ORF Transcript_100196/g.161537 Transcript_100196/m.161537 type:complete len:135 (-) Transcript_100196:350-754(-)